MKLTPHNMKKSIILIALFAASCSPKLSVNTFTPNTGYACNNPIFVRTMTKVSSNMGLDLSLCQLTKDAQNMSGTEASIQNVHWDIRNGIRVSVIYDVVICESKKCL